MSNFCEENGCNKKSDIGTLKNTINAVKNGKYNSNTHTNSKKFNIITTISTSNHIKSAIWMHHTYWIDYNVLKQRSNYQVGLAKTAWKTLDGWTY